MKAADERFEALPLPLKQAPQRVRLEPRQILSQGLGVFGGGDHHNRPRIASPNAEYALVDLGGLPLLGVRTTPCLSCEQGTGMSTLALFRAGEACTYGTGPDRQLLEPGFIHLNPRQGIPVQVGYLAGLFCPIDHSRLRSTLEAIGGGRAPGLDLEASWQLAGAQAAPGGQPPLLAFVAFVEALIADAPELPAAMGLADQLHRLLALSLLAAAGESAFTRRRRRDAAPSWGPALDDLVDYIRAASAQSLTLTDLEARSHFSARHLQTLFLHKFACTPIQFVRRQRLEAAMNRLNHPEPGDTVTGIARAFGYRQLSSFSIDVQRQFGVNPSTVLRAARRLPE